MSASAAINRRIWGGGRYLSEQAADATIDAALYMQWLLERLVIRRGLIVSGKKIGHRIFYAYPEPGGGGGGGSVLWR